jgi:transposase
LEKYPITARSLEPYYHIDGDLFERQYKEHLSDFETWDQLPHADRWILFPENMGPELSIDETSLSDGELYTIVTNKAGKGRKGSIVAIIFGTQAAKIIEILLRISKESRDKVVEVTLDMSYSMEVIVRSCFPNAMRTLDRFHVQKLANDAAQELRIKLRWAATNLETKEMEEAKHLKNKYQPMILTNGDTIKQLITRGRYLLFKSADKWTKSQKERARLLFWAFPELKQAYSLTHSLRMIYAHSKTKSEAKLALVRWYNKVEEAGFHSFNTIAAAVYEHLDRILNFFVNRATNASAESFNAKIKSFRATFRGVVDVKFFLFRLTKLYA